MRHQPIDTKLNLPAVTSVLKALYHSDIPVHCEGTSYVKPSKLFLPLNMVLRIQNDRGLDKDYNPTYYKKISLIIYEDSTAFGGDYRKNKTANYNHLFALEMFCDLSDKWEYKEGQDILTITESNYRVIESTNQYRRSPLGGNYDDTYPMNEQKGVEFIEQWFIDNYPTINYYLENEKNK